MTRWHRLRAWLTNHLFLSVLAGACVLASLYWGVIASDRYVSEAHVVLQRTDSSAGQASDIGALLTGGSGNRGDQMLLRDHLLSTDMLRQLDAGLGLRAHFSDSQRDLLSRLWWSDAPDELFQRYVRSRISVEFDDYGGLLVVRSQAYDPNTAYAITAMMVKEGENYMNRLAKKLAQDQVAFLEDQVGALGKRAIEARQDVVLYQNNKGLLSPEGTAENLSTVVNRLQTQLSELQSRRTAVAGYLTANAPGMVELDLQISAIERQMRRERERLTSSSGQTLNRTVEEYQRLKMAADFSQNVYSQALASLERGRMEAARTLRQVQVLQSPTLPQYPLEPQRLHHTLVSVLGLLLAAALLRLMLAIIKDHKD